MRKTLLSIVLLFTLVITACSNGNNNSNSSNASDNGTGSSPAAGTATAGQADSKYGGDLNVAITSAPPSLDPIFTSALQTVMPSLHVFETLVAYSEKSDIIPQLAASWEIANDDKEYTFALKQGVLFHNGNEMTAEDVKASLERYSAAGLRKDVFANLSAIEIVDTHKIKVVFKEPAPTFLAALANPLPPIVVMPKEFKDVEGGALTVDQLIGTGPFKYVSYTPDQNLKLAKFDQYVPDTTPASGFGGERIAYVDTVTFHIVPEKTSRLNGLLAGEYDYVEELDATSLSRLESESEVRADMISPKWSPLAIIDTVDGPLKNKTLRQAIRKVIDDDAIMLAASGDKSLYNLNHLLYLPGQMWYTEIGKDQYNQKDVEAAKALVQESGYNGEEIVLLTNRDYEFMYQVAIVLQAQMQSIGLNVKLTVQDWPTVADAIVNRKSDAYDITFSGEGYLFDPSMMDVIFEQFAPYDNPELLELLKQGRNTSDFGERVYIYSKVQQIVADDLPLIVFGNFDNVNGSSTKLQGPDSFYMLRFWNIWVDN